MSKPRRDKHYLADITEAIGRIISYTKDLTYEQFVNRTMVQDAVLRNLQVIGEATKKVSPSLCNANSDIPWREMAARGIRSFTNTSVSTTGSFGKLPTETCRKSCRSWRSSCSSWQMGGIDLQIVEHCADILLYKPVFILRGGESCTINE